VALGVLIVDDCRSFAKTAQLLLERQGVRVVGAACTSAAAVQLVADLRPEVVLVDLMLGEENGLDLARLLAQRGCADAPAVILISACPAVDVEELMAASPASGFLPKSDLSAEAIRRIVGDSRMRGGGPLAMRRR
jgi:two-component system nitrate/nitrite response regulator NarL